MERRIELPIFRFAAGWYSTRVVTLGDARLARKLPSGGRTNLGQPVGLGARNRLRIELRLLADQAREQVGIQVAVLGVAHQVGCGRAAGTAVPRTCAARPGTGRFRYSGLLLFMIRMA